MHRESQRVQKQVIQIHNAIEKLRQWSRDPRYTVFVLDSLLTIQTEVKILTQRASEGVSSNELY